jgi:hypothetical protein
MLVGGVVVGDGMNDPAGPDRSLDGVEELDARAEMGRDLARLHFVEGQIREIETTVCNGWNKRHRKNRTR